MFHVFPKPLVCFPSLSTHIYLQTPFPQSKAREGAAPERLLPLLLAPLLRPGPRRGGEAPKGVARLRGRRRPPRRMLRWLLLPLLGRRLLRRHGAVPTGAGIAPLLGRVATIPGPLLLRGRVGAVPRHHVRGDGQAARAEEPDDGAGAHAVGGLGKGIKLGKRGGGDAPGPATGACVVLYRYSW